MGDPKGEQTVAKGKRMRHVLQMSKAFCWRENGRVDPGPSPPLLYTKITFLSDLP